MRSDLATVVFGFGLSVRDVCTIESALEFFNYGYPVPAGCIGRLTQQASDWCQGYLSVDPVTVYLSTVTPDTPYFTITETSTIDMTTTQETTTTTETTITTSPTSTVELTLTSTTTPLPPSRRALMARMPDLVPQCGGPVCIDPSVSCIDLTEPNLRRRPAAGMSEACRCLLPPLTTVTLAATTSAVSTSTTTDVSEVTETQTEISVETDVSTAVVTEEATVTSTTTAIETAASTDKCSVRYLGGGNGSGNTVQSIPNVTSAVDCCQQCLAKPNCIASASSGPGNCQHLVKITPLAGAETSAQCPLGIEAYGGYGAPSDSGIIFAGPCSNV